jgi:hypothetical protein
MNNSFDAKERISVVLLFDFDKLLAPHPPPLVCVAVDFSTGGFDSLCLDCTGRQNSHH